MDKLTGMPYPNYEKIIRKIEIEEQLLEIEDLSGVKETEIYDVNDHYDNRTLSQKLEDWFSDVVIETIYILCC